MHPSIAPKKGCPFQNVFRDARFGKTTHCLSYTGRDAATISLDDDLHRFSVWIVTPAAAALI